MEGAAATTAAPFVCAEIRSVDSPVMSKHNRTHSKLRPICIVAIALMAMPALLGQQEDRAQIRMRASALERQGLNAEAEQVWDGIAKADPRDAEALAHLGLLEARQRHLETA